MLGQGRDLHPDLPAYCAGALLLELRLSWWLASTEGLRSGASPEPNLRNFLHQVAVLLFEVFRRHIFDGVKPLAH